MRLAFMLHVPVIALAGMSLHAESPQVLTNQLGYDSFSPKRAVIRGAATDNFTSFSVMTYPDGVPVFRGTVSPGTGVDKWRDWRFWSLSFDDVQRSGTYVIESDDNGHVVRSFPFRIMPQILARFTLFDVLAYFKAERVTGLFDKADAHIAFKDADRKPIDARGGWYDASGDYGVHLSHLDFSTYFNPQQAPLVAFSLGKTLELLKARKDSNYGQIEIRLADELAWGADFLVRMKDPEGSFYESIDGYADNKSAAARRITRTMAGGFGVRKSPTGAILGGAPEGKGFLNVGFRNGGGFSIAALAIAARDAAGGDFDRPRYLDTAEQAFAFLEKHNRELLNDGRENILDDYCALVASAELYRTTKKQLYANAADKRALSLAGRLTTSGGRANYWRADDRDRPFFHAADAGAPVVALLDYYDVASEAMREKIRDAVKRSLEFELSVTGEVPNPFGLARQYVQDTTGARYGSFFFPHNTETAPWWQGENATLASLAAAARLAAPLYPDDPSFQAKLQAFALNQLDWILGLNPFDASMLQGTGRNNPEYTFFTSWQYKSTPGGICNGITSGFFDEHNIDLKVPYEVTHQDSDWRWAEQWLPHAAWYMLAVAAGRTSPPPAEEAVIGYVFSRGKALNPDDIAATKLTHINYAFANIKDGRIIEGFEHDPENFRTLVGLKAKNPNLKILISVGGWTWSGGFSDMALTPASRAKFIESAVAFLRRYHLDGLDIDWEFPGQKGLNNVNRPEDKENSTALLAEARTALDKAGKEDGKRYLLTMATEAADEWLEHTEMDKASKYLDYVNLMAYDQFEASNDATTGHHAPLFTNPNNPKRTSAATMISHYIAAGVPASKIVLGVPFYGHAWGSVPAVNHGLYEPGKQPSERVYASFQNIEANLGNKNGYVRYWDDVSMAPYLYNAGRQIFVSYEDEQSVRDKAGYVMERGLGGIMFWEYSGDANGRLLTAINDVLRPTPAK